MIIAPFSHRGQTEKRRAGFTLVELLAALAVVSVASFVIISFFVSSMDLTNGNRSRKVAMALAEEHLASVVNNPQDFAWPYLHSLEPGMLVEVPMKNASAGEGNTVEPPSALPVARRAHDREARFYNRYSWQAFTRLPSKDSGYLEVTVVVGWTHQGRDYVVALTSSVTREQVEKSA